MECERRNAGARQPSPPYTSAPTRSYHLIELPYAGLPCSPVSPDRIPVRPSGRLCTTQTVFTALVDSSTPLTTRIVVETNIHYNNIQSHII